MFEAVVETKATVRTTIYAYGGMHALFRILMQTQKAPFVIHGEEGGRRRAYIAYAIGTITQDAYRGSKEVCLGRLPGYILNMQRTFVMTIRWPSWVGLMTWLHSVSSLLVRK